MRTFRRRNHHDEVMIWNGSDEMAGLRSNRADTDEAEDAE